LDVNIHNDILSTTKPAPEENAAMLTIDLKREATTPLYRQIHADLADRIRAGELQPGSRLPSVRSLAHRLGVSLITIVQAYDALASEGLVHAAVGRGTFVGGPFSSPPSGEARTGEPLPPPADAEWQTALPVYLRAPRIAAMHALLKPVLRGDVISLAGGTPDPTLFPLRTLGRLWRRVMAVEDPRFLQYGTPQGDRSLRTWIAGHCGSVGISARPDDVLITSGSQQAIDLIARTFVGPGEYVLVESPTFPTALDIFEGRGAKLLGVPVDVEGMRVDIADALAERYRPRLVYTIPTAQNPTGATMSEDRRLRLSALARRHNLFILEDDTCSEFAYDGDAPPAIKAFDTGGHILFIKSFSKTVIPGLRVGCVVARGTVLDRLIESKSVVDRFTSPLIQRTLWRYLSSRQYSRDLDTARETYRRRRDAILRALERSMPPGVTWTHPAAGFNLWLTLPDGVSAPEAFEEGLKEGVACGLGDLFLPHTPPPSGLRISFADKPESTISEGIRRLAPAIKGLISREPGKGQEREFMTSV
jgi:DNA-binding transcriptional MocR family regulator